MTIQLMMKLISHLHLSMPSLELSEDIMNDCSILTDGSDMGVEIDVDWIRAHARPRRSDFSRISPGSRKRKSYQE